LHIQTLLLGTVVPASAAEFVYADAEAYHGEAAGILRVAGIAGAGKPAETVHHELQRTGIFVAHVLECPLETGASGEALAALVVKRLPGTLTRIRRSIKPKRVALFGIALESVLGSFTAAALGCDVLLDGGDAFKLDESAVSAERLRAALAHAPAAVR
jgi:hypothetical protein